MARRPGSSVVYGLFFEVLSRTVQIPIPERKPLRKCTSIHDVLLLAGQDGIPILGRSRCSPWRERESSFFVVTLVSTSSGRTYCC